MSKLDKLLAGERVTDFSITKVTLPLSGWLILKDETKRLIELYSTPVFFDHVVKFEIASYRWAEIAKAQGMESEE